MCSCFFYANDAILIRLQHFFVLRRDSWNTLDIIGVEYNELKSFVVDGFF